MEYTMIEKTKIPVIALGTWSWGTGLNGGNSVFGNNLQEKDLKPVFEKAMAENLNLWDTAAVYGMGAAETILGKFIADSKANPIVSTKFTPLPFQKKCAMKKSAEKSMLRLQINCIDIFWIHNPQNVTKWTNETIPLIKDGTIKHIGVSNHNLDQIKLADTILKNAGLKLDAVQNHYSLLYRSSEDAGILDWCKANDVKFFSYMVLEQGALTGVYHAQNPFPAKTRRSKAFGVKELTALSPLIEKMKEVANQYDAKPAEIAIAWALAKGTLPIIGATKVHHIESAVKAVQIKLSKNEIIELESTAKNTGISIKASWEK